MRVAIAQARPVYYDLEATLQKTESLVAEAVRRGAAMVAFPETWLPGYPAWLDCCRDIALWDHAPTKRLFARLAHESIVIPGPVVTRLEDLAEAHDVVLVIGANERIATGQAHGTLYNTVLTIDPEAGLVHVHRKIMPTHTERLVWGMGDGGSLRVATTSYSRVGALVCWEHWMPLARQTMHESHEQIHVALWPWVKEMNLVASRHYAFEGRCFVLAAGTILAAGDLPRELILAPELAYEDLVLRGGSAIIGPDGALLSGPAGTDEEILVADLDFLQLAAESMTLDVTGHYARPDIFTLQRHGPLAR